MITECQEFEDNSAEREYKQRFDSIAKELDEIRRVTNSILTLCGMNPQNTSGQ
jgi:hypothetical protein